MRVGFPRLYRQAFIALFSVFCVCCGKAGDVPLVPPPTSPMVREFIGYGVVKVSFIAVMDKPLDGTSLGYLRRRSPVRIIERRALKSRGNVESWVKIDAGSLGSSEGIIQGWLNESSLTIYQNEEQSFTAAELMTP